MSVKIAMLKTSKKHHCYQVETAKRVVRKYRMAKAPSTANSYWRLKKLVPTIKSKENISKLDVVLEAISYIQRLQHQL